MNIYKNGKTQSTKSIYIIKTTRITTQTQVLVVEASCSDYAKQTAMKEAKSPGSEFRHGEIVDILAVSKINTDSDVIDCFKVSEEK